MSFGISNVNGRSDAYWIPVACAMVASGIGVTAAHSAGITPRTFLPNLLGIIIGVGLLFGAQAIRKRISKNPVVAGSGFIALIGLTLLDAGQEGVHRWVHVGPLALHASMVLLPLLLFCLDRAEPLPAVVMSFALSAIFVVQPDAAQATCFAVAVTPISISKNTNGFFYRTLGILNVFGAMLWAWMRTDPLQPVSHVERILHLIAATSFLGPVAVGAAVSILFVPFATILRKATARERPLLLSYFLLLLTSVVVTEFGHFPVPVVGAGAAAVIGWFLMMSFSWTNLANGTSLEGEK